MSREDDDARRDAIDERRRFIRMTRCRCGHDLPGRCPGPMFCPYSGVGEDEPEDRP